MSIKFTIDSQFRFLIPIPIILAVLFFGKSVLPQYELQSNSPVQEQVRLLEILRDRELQEHEPDRVANAIKRLGELKSLTAIDDLVQLLTFRQYFEWETPKNGIIEEPHLITVFSRYPATNALFKIGKPSLQSLIKVIEMEETGSLASENALYTVIVIFRDAPSEGEEYLKEAASKASSLGASYRLLEATEKLRKFYMQK